MQHAAMTMAAQIADDANTRQRGPVQWDRIAGSPWARTSGMEHGHEFGAADPSMGVHSCQGMAVARPHSWHENWGDAECHQSVAKVERVEVSHNGDELIGAGESHTLAGVGNFVSVS